MLKIRNWIQDPCHVQNTVIVKRLRVIHGFPSLKMIMMDSDVTFWSKPREKHVSETIGCCTIECEPIASIANSLDVTTSTVHNKLQRQLGTWLTSNKTPWSPTAETDSCVSSGLSVNSLIVNNWSHVAWNKYSSPNIPNQIGDLGQSEFDGSFLSAAPCANIALILSNMYPYLMFPCLLFDFYQPPCLLLVWAICDMPFVLKVGYIPWISRDAWIIQK